MNRCGYDTIRLKSENHPDSLSNIQDLTYHSKPGKSDWQTGYIGGMRISIHSQGTTIQGSLASFLRGNNWLLASPQDASESLTKLSELLELDLFQAKVARLDFAQDIVVDNRPHDYYPYLGIIPGKWTRRQDRNTLYYDQIEKQLAIYDKIKQMAKEGHFLPPGIEAAFIIRCELRLLKRAYNALKRPITGLSLTDPVIFDELEAMHQKLFQGIPVVVPAKFDMRHTPLKEWKEQGLALALQSIGLDEVKRQLSKPAGPETQAAKQTRYQKRRIAEGLMRKQLTKYPDTLAHELSHKIKTAGRKPL